MKTKKEKLAYGVGWNEGYKRGLDVGREQGKEDGKVEVRAELQAERIRAVTALLQQAGQYQEAITRLVMSAEKQL